MMCSWRTEEAVQQGRKVGSSVCSLSMLEVLINTTGVNVCCCLVVMQNMTGSSEPGKLGQSPCLAPVSSPAAPAPAPAERRITTLILLSAQPSGACGWQPVPCDYVSKTTSWTGAWRHWRPAPQWASQGPGWHKPGRAMGDHIVRNHRHATEIKIHLPSNHPGARRCNWPK